MKKNNDLFPEVDSTGDSSDFSIEVLYEDSFDDRPLDDDGSWDDDEHRHHRHRHKHKHEKHKKHRTLVGASRVWFDSGYCGRYCRTDGRLLLFARPR